MLIYDPVEAGDAGWGTAGTLVPLAIAVVLYGVFVAVERAVSAPLMQASTLVRRPVVSGTFVMLLATVLMLALFFLSSLYLQRVLGFSALRTGLTFLPVAIAITIAAQLASHLISKVGGRPVTVAGFLVTAAGIGLMTRISPQHSAYTTLLPGFMVAAVGIGPLFVVATTTTLANVPHTEAVVASGVINTFHELGGSIGVAAVSTLAAASLAPDATSVTGFTAALTAAAITAGVAAGVAAAIALTLVPQANRPRVRRPRPRGPLMVLVTVAMPYLAVRPLPARSTRDRLTRHLESWLGRWPATTGLDIVGSTARTAGGWDGRAHPALGVASPDSAVLSFAPDRDVRAVYAREGSLAALGLQVPAAVGFPARGWYDVVFRWTLSPAPLPDVGEWVPATDERLPEWLRPFGGEALVAFDARAGSTWPAWGSSGTTSTAGNCR